MAKIKQIGGSPNEILANAKDILIWFKCLENKSHPSYLITPYDITVRKLGCPLCEGREIVTPYQIRIGIKLNDDDCQTGTFGSNGYFTTIKEAKEEVTKIYNSTVKKMFSSVKHDGLIMVHDLKCDCGCNYQSATYEDGTELVGRMDGTFDSGEFYIEIVKA